MRKGVILAIVFGLLCLSVYAVSATTTFQLTTTVKGYGTGTFVSTTTSPNNLGEGTAFVGNNMNFVYSDSNTIKVSPYAPSISCVRYVHVTAPRIKYFTTYLNMYTISTVFTTMNVHKGNILYTDGMKMSESNYLAFRNISLTAKELGWHKDFNLMTSERAMTGYAPLNVTHEFVTNAKAKNVTFTLNSTVTRTRYGNVLTYNLSYTTPKVVGNIYNHYTFGSTNSTTMTKGKFFNYSFGFDVKVPVPVYGVPYGSAPGVVFVR